MPVTTTLQEEKSVQNRIFVTRYGEIDYKQLRSELSDRAAAGQITDRDELLLEYLRELHVMSLDQIQRLLWPKAGKRTTYNRLNILRHYKLLSFARVPGRSAYQWGLPQTRVYALNLGGWMWLREEVNSELVARSLKREQVLHDLLVAEVCVRIIESTRLRGPAWQTTWAGEEAASYYDKGERDGDKKAPPLIAPDGLGIIRMRQEKQVAALPLFFEMDSGREAHGRPSSDWARKVQRYNQFYADAWRQHPQLADLPEFPAVAVITHGPQRLLNLAFAIEKYRKEPVSYYLALWEDLMAARDILSAPAWLMLTADGKVLGQERDQRRPLLPPVVN